MKLWYEFHKRMGTLPEPYQDFSLRDIEEDLGMGTPAREGKIFEVRLSGNIKVIRQEKDLEVITHYVTPKGTVTEREKTSQKGYSLEIVEHLIKSVDDYPIVEYLIEHLEFVPSYEDYLQYEDQIGEASVPLVRAGLWPPERKTGFHCPMHRILRGFLGYKRGYIHLHRHPEKVLRLLELLTEKAKEMQKIVLKSPAKLILHGGHFDSQMTPPPIFKEYFLPYFRDFSEKLHSCGKKLACHLDAETKGLFELISEADFDIADCFTTVPLVRHTTLAEARERWKDKIVIWGGIPSTILEPNYNLGKFKLHMFDLFKTIAPGDHFILGIADNLMPSSDFGKVIQISKMMQYLGEYPLEMERIETYFSDG